MDPIQALGDPVRRRLVEALARQDMSAGELAALTAGEYGISQPAASRHLRVLREAGVVTSTVRGQSRVYSLDRGSVDDIAAWADGIRSFWNQRLDALDTEVRRGRRDDVRAGGERAHPQRKEAS